MTKTFFAIIGFIAVVVTGCSVYVFARKADSKKHDRERLFSLATSIFSPLRSLWNYATKLFSSDKPAEAPAQPSAA